MKANLLYRCYDTIGEAVTWLPDMKTLLWVDIDSGILHQYNLESQKMEEHQFPEMITAVIPWKGHEHEIILAMKNRLVVYHLVEREYQVLLELTGLHSQLRTNDCKASPEGRIWCGVMHLMEHTRTGSLYCINNDLSWVSVLTEQYIPNGMESGIPLRATSGVVTELTPLILLLKYARHLREICYEEPEMCLHPQLQYQMARLIIRMVNSKINIVASTHSDIIIQHINNMCQMCGADADDKTLERMGLDREDLISVDKIAVYQFKGNAGKTRVERILPEDNTFKVPSFMDALKNILNKTIAVSDIVYGEDD